MIEHLLNLLPCHHLLNKTVDFSKLSLLPVKILFTLFSVNFYEHKHHRQEHDYNEREPDAQHHHHDYGSEKLHEALDNHRKAAVHRLLHGVDIVRETAHQLAVRVCVKIAERKLLRMRKQVTPYLPYNLLRGDYHESVIAKGCQHTAEIHRAHAKNRPDKSRRVTRYDEPVDYGL